MGLTGAPAKRESVKAAENEIKQGQGLNLWGHVDAALKRFDTFLLKKMHF